MLGSRATSQGPRGTRWRRLAAAGAASLIAACVTLEWKPIGPRRTAAILGAQQVGSEECLTCHEDVQGHAKIASYHSGCETCHGGGSIHSESEKLGDIRFPANSDCLACHAVTYDTHLQWGTGEHSRAGLLCSDCHNPHAIDRLHLRNYASVSFPDMDAPSALCIECHRDIEARLNYPSHHPVREGAMGCLACHDPHEDSRVQFGDRNQRCATCHQDYMGPWVFEHPPAVEACTICHDPHGAVTDNLLETIQPAICLSCHSLNDMWHHNPGGTGIGGNVSITGDLPTAPGEVVTTTEAMTFLRRCTDCHNAIHGSYTDEHLRH